MCEYAYPVYKLFGCHNHNLKVVVRIYAKSPTCVFISSIKIETFMVKNELGIVNSYAVYPIQRKNSQV